jgi:hypothetical protein
MRNEEEDDDLDDKIDDGAIVLYQAGRVGGNLATVVGSGEEVKGDEYSADNGCDGRRHRYSKELITRTAMIRSYE